MPECFPGIRACFLSLAFACLVHAPLLGAGEALCQAQGIMAGEVTATTALLQTRLTSLPGPDLDAQGDVPGAGGLVRFEWDVDPEFANPRRSDWLTAEAGNDYLVRAEVTGLPPATRVHYRTVVGARADEAGPGLAGSFRTLPGALSSETVSFCMGSCMHYHAFMSGQANGGGPVTATAEDKQLGYPSFAAMAKLRPDFLVATGDIVYYDHPTSAPATTLPELRRKWHEQFRFPRLRSFLATTPAFWSKDDHDFRFDDADAEGAKAPAAATGIDLFREQMPLLPMGNRDRPTYRTHRVNRHLQLWFIEGRDHRSPNSQSDGPDKSLWGAAQRDWLRSTLAASDATWRILVSPTPLVGPDRDSKRDNHANTRGFRREADDFFQWITAQGISNLLVLCGDRHWQYHSVHPSGVEEFGCGALNDENAIAGIRPGTPKSTDPAGRIRQPFLYPKPTGGFLHVSCASVADGAARLNLAFHDDHGVASYQVEKQAGGRK